MFSRYAAGRTQKVHHFEFGGHRPKQEQNPILRSLKSSLDFEYPSFYLTSEINKGTVSIVLIDQVQSLREHMLSSFENDNEVGFSFYTNIPNISSVENYFIQKKKSYVHSSFTVLPPDFEAIKRKINMCLESFKKAVLESVGSRKYFYSQYLRFNLVPKDETYIAYFTLPKEVVNPSVIEAPVPPVMEVKAPIIPRETPAVKKAPTKLTIPELLPYYNALKDVIGYTRYNSLHFGVDSSVGVKTHTNPTTIAVKNPPSDYITTLEDVSTDTHIAFSGRLMINTVKKYLEEEKISKDTNDEMKAFGMRTTEKAYLGESGAKNLSQQALKNAKAEFINAASQVNLPKFSELLNIEIYPFSNTYEIKGSLSKKDILNAIGTQQPIPRKRAPKQEAFEPVTPKTRAVKKPPVVKKSPVVKAPPVVKTPAVKKAPTFKNPPIKLSVAELQIEKELFHLNSYMDFTNLSPSDVNEIVLSLKPLTDKVIRNDQFAVYDKKLSPSTDKSGVISNRLVAKIILLFKQLDKFYDLGDLEPIELVDVISQILPVFNKLPALKISPKKASFYRYLF